MSKIIIDIRDGIGDYEAIDAVFETIKIGLISTGANNKKHYCWHTEYLNGIHVSVSPKYKTDTNKFIVHLNKP
jgi:hypothetical protein